MIPTLSVRLLVNNFMGRRSVNCLRLLCSAAQKPTETKEDPAQKIPRPSSANWGERKSSANYGKGKSPVTWKSVASTATVGGLLLAYLFYLKKKKEEIIEKEKFRSIGKPLIGGPFELMDQNGKVVTNEDFLGQWYLMYFGFTHCPDVCPDELEKLSKVINAIDAYKNLPPMQPLFISVDPERDTQAVVKEYLKEFNPRLMGLTGTPEQIKNICHNYRVYYSAGPKDKDKDYIVDHTIMVYLFSPDGEFADHYGQNRTAEEIIPSIIKHMKTFPH